MRFTSTSALGARIRRPLNSFRWVGPGKLRISDRGILVTANSATLLGLRQTQRFIPAAQLNDVYREANAVQVHLRGPRNPYFRFWAEDAAHAAQIVALLPTRHTIEFESALEQPQARPPWPAYLAWLAALCAAILLVITLAWLSGYPLGVRRGASVAAPPAAAQPTAPAVSARHPASPVSAADLLRARQDLRTYGARLQALRTEFDIAFEALMDGKVSQSTFADQSLQWLLPQWEELELEVRRAGAPAGSLQESADRHLLAAVNDWQLALRAYTDDLHNGRQAVDTFDYLRRADVQQSAATALLARLEAGQGGDTTAPALH